MEFKNITEMWNLLLSRTILLADLDLIPNGSFQFFGPELGVLNYLNDEVLDNGLETRRNDTCCGSAITT